MERSEQAERICEALARHPGLLHEVLTVARKKYRVLGPWSQHPERAHAHSVPDGR